MSIHILEESVARKIAAGEVIDRPFSVVRELLDNSLDAGAKRIETYIEDGGRSSIRVVDDGSGMTADDLSLCTLSHATSKIHHEDDLLKVNSLGFRGEALSSIAAVSRLSIRSRQPESNHGHSILCSLENRESVKPAASPPGTTIEVRDLFYNLPARRHFLKTASAETGLIKRIITDRALAFPDAAFTLQVDTRKDLQLMPASRQQRVQQLFSKQAPANLWFQAHGSGEGFSIEVIGVKPDIYRKDRRYLQAFVNTRRVNEFSLQQAAEYAYSDYIPGGNYPICFVFVEMDPYMVDFNIHPAKKEVRFRDKGSLHHRVVEVVRSALRGSMLSTRTHAQQQGSFQSYDFDFPRTPAVQQSPITPSTPPSAVSQQQRHAHYDLDRYFEPPRTEARIPQKNGDLRYRYLGQLFDVFLLVESDDRLFIIDMHAGHERLRYDVLRNTRSSQPLMVPIAFTAQDAQSVYLQAHTAGLQDIGIQIRRVQGETWELIAVPETFTGDPHRLLPFLTGKTGHAQQLSVYLYATIACRSAVKEGDRLLPEQAHQIIQGVFQLENSRCPHGRPIWIEWDRRTLYKMVGRE